MTDFKGFRAIQSALIGISLCIVTMQNASAADEQQLYPELTEQAKNLTDHTQQYFNGMGALPEDLRFTPTLLKNPQRHQANLKLWHLLRLAIDADYDLSALEPYGIIKDEQGSLTLSRRAYPQWASIVDFARMLHRPYSPERPYDILRELNFSSIDIGRLRQYLNQQDPSLFGYEAEIAQLLAHHRQQLSLEQIVALKKQKQKIVEQQWFDWSVGLFNLFSETQQQQFIDHFQPWLGVTSFVQNPVKMAQFEEYAQDLHNGTLLKRTFQWYWRASKSKPQHRQYSAADVCQYYSDCLQWLGKSPLQADLAVLYPQKLARAKLLPQLARDYYYGVGALSSAQTLTPEMAKNPQRNAKLAEFWDLLGMALDAELDVSAITALGFKKDNNGYKVNLGEHPQWASLSRLFLWMAMNHFDSTDERNMRKLGLNELEIKMLGDYAKRSDDYIFSLKAEIAQITPYLLSEENPAPAKLTIEQVMQLKQKAEQNAEQMKAQWWIDMLNLFSLETQKRLLDKSIISPPLVSIGHGPLSIKSVEKYRDDIQSGALLMQLQSELKEREDKLKLNNEKAAVGDQPKVQEVDKCT